MSILIVDDSEDSRLLIKHLLNEGGHTDILAAGSPCEAFELLRITNEAIRCYEQGGIPTGPDEVGANADLKIDLILMDEVMPRIEGIETFTG